MTRRITWLVALAALIALAIAPTGIAGSKKGYKLSRGATTVTVDPALAGTLTTAGVTITANKPAKAVGTTDAPNQFRFPITNGRALVSTTDGTITVKSVSVKHVGGLTLTQGDKSLSLRNPWVASTDKGATLTANVAGQRVEIATVSGGAVAPALAVSGKHNRNVSVTGITLTLTDAAAQALSTTFGVTVPSGTTLGTATVDTRVVGKGPKGKPAKPAKTHAKPTTTSHKH